jgi:hypothetical protein
MSCMCASLVAAWVTAAASAQEPKYVWGITTQDVFASTVVSATAQTQNVTSNPSDFDPVGGLAASGDIVEVTEAVFGGGGGDGGGGGPGGDPGADGIDAIPLDGANGPDNVAQGGAGGLAGANAETYARAHSDGSSAVGPTNNVVLSWSFIHNQDGTLDVEGAGGGGGGGGGGGADGGDE